MRMSYGEGIMEGGIIARMLYSSASKAKIMMVELR